MPDGSVVRMDGRPFTGEPLRRNDNLATMLSDLTAINERGEIAGMVSVCMMRDGTLGFACSALDGLSLARWQVAGAVDALKMEVLGDG